MNVDPMNFFLLVGIVALLTWTILTFIPERTYYASQRSVALLVTALYRIETGDIRPDEAAEAATDALTRAAESDPTIAAGIELLRDGL